MKNVSIFQISSSKKEKKEEAKKPMYGGTRTTLTFARYMLKLCQHNYIFSLDYHQSEGLSTILYNKILLYIFFSFFYFSNRLAIFYHVASNSIYREKSANNKQMLEMIAERLSEFVSLTRRKIYRTGKKYLMR